METAQGRSGTGLVLSKDMSLFRRHDTAQMEAHIPRLRRYARALLGDPASADDLVQDTLERALNKFSLWRRDSDLRAWLFTVMHNVYVNQRRAYVRQANLLASDHEVNGMEAPGSQEELLSLRDIERALSQLPDEFREVVLLVGVEQMSYEEVSQVLGIPKGTVMSRLSRGRERLRLLMAGEEPMLRRVK